MRVQQNQVFKANDQQKLHFTRDIIRRTLMPRMLLRPSHLNSAGDLMHSVLFKRYPALSPRSVFLYSLPVSQCALDFKLFVCFYLTVNSVVLNLSILQSGPIGTLHSISTTPSICSLGHGVP